MARCPHCQQTIDPPPKRSRKCPHCREPIELRKGKLLTPEAAEALDAKLIAAEARERFREGRQKAVREIRQARQSGVVTGFKLLVSANDCDVCQAVRDRFFPVETCTPEMLPPYENCKLQDGCRATFTCTLAQQYEDLLAKYPPGSRFEEKGLGPKSKTGCLGVAIAVFVLISIALWTVAAGKTGDELVDTLADVAVDH
jgi:hypothetical protein